MRPREIAPVIRVVVLGAESTGKTTLCTDLSARLGVPFVPEFGRWYTEAMPDPQQYAWSPRDFELIAETQNRFEDDAAQWIEGGVLLCDTSSYVTQVFEEVYLGGSSPAVRALAAGRRYDLYLLCDLATPETADATGLRKQGDLRRAMHDRYLSHAREGGAPVVELSGSREQRVERALEAIAAATSVGPAPASRRPGADAR